EMLRSGEADAYVNADDAQYPQLRDLPGVRTERAPIDGTGALIFNTTRPGLNDPRVRRAIAEAIDVHGIVDKTLLGVSRARDPGQGLFEWAYDPRIYAMPAYDPADAARLLDAAGWHRGTDGMRRKNGAALAFDLIARADKPSAVEIATQILEQERSIGVAISIRHFAVSALVAPDGPLYGGHYDIALFPFIAGFDPDVTDQFACHRIPPHGFNKSRYCNRTLDVLMRAAVRPYDRAARLPYYRKIERILASQLPMVVMYQAVSIDAFPNWLRGESSAPNTPFWNVAGWH
ncbi:MAG TPA: ABC transporter substrate-binding protein, partial [Candidatus Aquilonibacter sp.]